MFAKKIGKMVLFKQKNDYNIGFQEKLQLFLRRKLAKKPNSVNDNNIDPWSQVLVKLQNLATCQKIKLYIRRKFDHESKLPSPQVAHRSLISFRMDQ
jgi:hypothetical protein